MARNPNFTVSERIPDATALPGQSDTYAALELSCFDGWEDEDPDAYRALGAPKPHQHLRFDAEVEDLDDATDSQFTDLEGLIESLAAEEFARQPIDDALEPIDEAYVAPLDDEGVTLQEFDFRQMARIIEERERMKRAESPPPPEPAPRDIFVLPLPRGTRVERRLWRREVDRLAS